MGKSSRMQSTTTVIVATLFLFGSACAARGGLQSPCNPNGNFRDCKRGFTCSPIYGNPNQNGQCLPSTPAPAPTSSCWLGPECTEKVVGIDHSSNYAMIKNNCYDKKSMCKAHNDSPTPSPAGFDLCYANKGGMCIPLQQAPGYYGDNTGRCWATRDACQRNLPSPSPSPDRGTKKCRKCLNKSVKFLNLFTTWCWRDQTCYPTGSWSNPCRNSQCASNSPQSTCAIKNSDCAAH